MSDDESPDDGGDYPVGYGRPPKHSRFAKGQSGNPRGRRKGSRSLKTDLDNALKETLTITVGGKKRRGTTQALAMYALAVKSATGDQRASKQLTDLVLTIFGPEDRRARGAKLSRNDEELLKRFLERDGAVQTEANGDEAAPSTGSVSNAPMPGGENSDG
jgi:hypothetical protein